MKKRYRLNENGKFLLGTIVIILLAIVVTIFYVKEIEKINNGEITITNDSEMEK